eukprot:2522461-Ditylum_brightwellii.AAC.1
MASAVEVELGALFENAKEAVLLHTTLTELEISSQQPQYKWIIQPHMGLYIAKYINTNQNQLICNSIG